MLRGESLTYRYGNPQGESFPVFEGLNIEIEAGSFVALLGHNGCGKSTLAKHFNGMLKPSSGVMWVGDVHTLQKECIFQIRSSVGMVFQNPDNQIVATLVEEDVAFALENLGVPPEEIRKRVDWALQAVGMYEFRMYAPHLLSGGQKQRVAIAGVLAMEPKCIVLDEPTAMLDPVGRKEVMETIVTLNREKGVTVVLITHHMEEAALAERLIVMDAGKILLDGTGEKVFSQVEFLEGLGLAVPETVKLLWELRCRGVDVPLGGVSLESCGEILLSLLA